jgi:hypothetical protein
MIRRFHMRQSQRVLIISGFESLLINWINKITAVNVAVSSGFRSSRRKLPEQPGMNNQCYLQQEKQ